MRVSSCVIGALLLVSGLPLAAQTLSIQQAVHQALQHDVWLTANEQQQQALTEQAVAAGQLPDPVLSINAANLPTDGFSLHQEGMTQMKVGIAQQFPAGKTLALKNKQYQQQAAVQPWLRAQRRAFLSWQVRQQWLSAWAAQQSIALIEKRRPLFTQLVRVTRDRYQATAGNTQQQNVVKAQLALTRLDDRITRLQQQYDEAQQQLSRWLPASSFSATLTTSTPEIATPPLIAITDWQQLAPALTAHPQVRAYDAQLAAADTKVDIAKQQYHPKWGVSASYGWRDDDAMGRHRADLFSVGIKMSLPLFPGKRQDKTVSAASHEREAQLTRRQLLVQQLRSRYRQAFQRLQRLNERADRYQHTLLSQFHQQSQAELNAYTSDTGHFADVMQAYIGELDAQLEMVQIDVARQKTRALLAYLLAGEQQQGDH